MNALPRSPLHTSATHCVPHTLRASHTDVLTHWVPPHNKWLHSSLACAPQAESQKAENEQLRTQLSQAPTGAPSAGLVRSALQVQIYSWLSHCVSLSPCLSLTVCRSHCVSLSLYLALSHCVSLTLCLTLTVSHSHCASLTLCFSFAVSLSLCLALTKELKTKISHTHSRFALTLLEDSCWCQGELTQVRKGETTNKINLSQPLPLMRPHSVQPSASPPAWSRGLEEVSIH